MWEVAIEEKLEGNKTAEIPFPISLFALNTFPIIRI